MNPIYRFEVQLSPQLHMGTLHHYWHVYMVDGDNKITVEHGYEVDVLVALQKAYKLATRYK